MAAQNFLIDFTNNTYSSTETGTPTLVEYQYRLRAIAPILYSPYRLDIPWYKTGGRIKYRGACKLRNSNVVVMFPSDIRLRSFDFDEETISEITAGNNLNAYDVADFGDGTVLVLNSTSGSASAFGRVSLADGGFTSVPIGLNGSNVSPDTRLYPIPGVPEVLVVGYSTGQVAIVNGPDLITTIIPITPTRTIYRAAVAHDGSGAWITNSVAPYLHFLDFSTGTLTAVTGGNLPGGVGHGLALSPDGNTLAVMHNNGGGLTLIDTSTWARTGVTLPSVPSGSFQVTDFLDFTEDGAYLVAVRRGAFTARITMGTNEVVSLGEPPSSTIQAKAFLIRCGGEISNADTTPVVDAMNQPIVRTVELSERRGYAAFISSHTTDENGRYAIPCLKKKTPLKVTFVADNDTENSVVVDWVYPE